MQETMLYVVLKEEEHEEINITPEYDENNLEQIGNDYITGIQMYQDMNEKLRKWAMKIIIGMIQDKIAEWEVRRYALDNYNKGILTSEDLDIIDEMYKEEEPIESEQVDAQVNEQDIL